MDDEVTQEQESAETLMTKKERRVQLAGARHTRTSRRVFMWVTALIAIISIGASAVYFGTKNNPPEEADNSTTPLTASESDNWVRGNTNAAVTLVEYGDFQCPACASYYPLVKQLETDFDANAQFVFRHFPLKRTHPNAEIAAYAAEAAGKQGKFWEMHDVLFERQKEWSLKPNARGALRGYAEELGLNGEQFENDLSTEDVKNAVREDMESGLAAGVNATPTFFLNGVKLESPQSYEEFRTLILQAIDVATEQTNEPQPNP